MAAIILIVFILCVVIGINMTVCADTKKHGEKVSHAKLRRLTWAVGCVFIVFVLITSCIEVIPTGYTGIVTSFGKVKDTTFEAGINFKMPWEAVIEMDNREQRINYSLEAYSSDIQIVDIQGSVNLNINKETAMSLYREVGTDYVNVLVWPRIQETVKTIIAGYTAETLVENRQQASEAIFNKLKEELQKKGINIISFAVENLDFDDAFESAISAKQVATQEAQRAKTVQDQQTMEAQQAAKRRTITAETEAEIAKIQADADAYALMVKADAEAKANLKISESLTDNIIQYNYIHQWNGQLPTITTLNDSIEFLTNPLDLMK